MSANGLPLPQNGKISQKSSPPLRLVFWESTTGCNLACVHCRRLEVSQQLSKLDLTTAQAISFIQSLSRAGSPVLVFSGGEPLMRTDFFELAQTATAAGLPIALATNGTIMDPDLARRIAAVGVRRVSISFDGPDAAIHDKFRGLDGAFQKSVNGFGMLKAAGVSMQINTTIARHNYHRLDDMYAMALQLGADALHIFMLVPVGCGMSLSEDIMLSSEEYEHALNWIYDKSLEGRLHLKATCAPHYFRVMRQCAKSDGHPMPLAAHPHRSMAAPAGHPTGHPGGPAPFRRFERHDQGLSGRASHLLCFPHRRSLPLRLLPRFQRQRQTDPAPRPLAKQPRLRRPAQTIPNWKANAVVANTKKSAWAAAPVPSPRRELFGRRPIAVTRQPECTSRTSLLPGRRSYRFA